MESIDALIERASSSSHAQQDLACGCCGSLDCAFLRNGASTVAGLERDVRAAARVGQALLIRHEAYVADAEKEREHMGNTITDLETSKGVLEQENARVVAENRSLINQLDSLNASLEESDSQIQDLTTTLSLTHQELTKLRTLAARAERLETELEKLEADQAELRNTLATSDEEKRAANLRWRQSQRTVEELHLQMELIDREAKEDRLRHAAILKRLEKRKAVDDVLHGAKERLNRDNTLAGNEVVTNFVKEILEDNTKLQLSMAELQTMLVSSQDESEYLRSQLEMHQVGPPIPPGRSLGEELADQKPEPSLSQQLHVHHHYHAPTSASVTASRGKALSYQRPRRKRQVLASGRSTPMIPEMDQVENMHSRDSSTASSVYGHEAGGRPNRWSAHSRSSFALSSGPSSPTSHAPSTIFEHADDGNDTDYTRPTSPESVGLWSPALRPSHRKGPSDDSFIQPLSVPRDSFISPPKPQREEDQTRRVSEPLSSVLHGDLDLTAGPNENEEADSEPARDQRPLQTSPARPPRLKRTASTSSLLSISGMDIHSTFPSTPTYSTPAALRARPSFTTNPSNSGPVLTAATASASRHYTGGKNDIGQTLRQQISSRDIRATGKTAAADGSYTPLYDTLGRAVGGWFAGRFSGAKGNAADKPESESPSNGEGATIANGANPPPKSTEPVRSRLISPLTSPTEEKKLPPIYARAPGVNQTGAIPIPPSPRRRNGKAVLASVLDSDALRECLDEDEQAEASLPTSAVS